MEEAGWAPRPVWTGMERRKSSVPTGVRTPNRPAYRDFEPQRGAGDFHFSTPVQTGPGVQPASCTFDMARSPGGKVADASVEKKIDFMYIKLSLFV